MKKQELCQIVTDTLRSHIGALGDYKFQVLLEMSFRDEEDLWHVFIQPDKPVRQRGQFYDLLNDVEEQVEKEHRENVMIVPVKSKQEETSVSQEA
jgi:hypothetical protein